MTGFVDLKKILKISPFSPTSHPCLSPRPGFFLISNFIYLNIFYNFLKFYKFTP